MKVTVTLNMRRGQFEVELDADEYWDSRRTEQEAGKTIDQAVQAVKHAAGIS